MFLFTLLDFHIQLYTDYSIYFNKSQPETQWRKRSDVTKTSVSNKNHYPLKISHAQKDQSVWENYSIELPSCDWSVESESIRKPNWIWITIYTPIHLPDSDDRYNSFKKFKYHIDWPLWQWKLWQEIVLQVLQVRSSIFTLECRIKIDINIH